MSAEQTGVQGETAEVLVVDDSPANRLALAEALSPLGVNVVAASSGVQALRQMLLRDFAAIVLDVQMPGMSGLETARAIRQRVRARHVPIIFVTAYDQDGQVMAEAYELGAVDFLVKPFPPQILRAKVAALVELSKQASQISRQAERERAAEREENARRLQQERARWETDALRARMEIEQRNASILRDKADALASAVGRLERSETELLEANRQLIVVNRSKDEFLALLGHELRNPLAPILSGLELMKAHPCEHPIHARMIATQERQLQHLARLVDDLLDVSRIASGRMELRRERISLGDLIAESIAICEPILAAQQQVLATTIERATIADVDPSRIKQVVCNLLINASRYSGRGQAIEVDVRASGKDAIVRVRDEGQGIAPEMLPRIFDSFVQANRDSAGFGIGLALVRRIVELHGGSVSAHSSGLGAGSVFVVTLPVVVDDLRQEDARAEATTATPDQPLRLVIIEDNDDARATLKELLERMGHEVFEAADALAGMDLVMAQRPQIALVDIGLPVVDGLTVARELRRRFSRTELRLVAVTGFGQASDRARSVAAGFDVHLTKPVRAGDLEKAIRHEAT